MNAVRSIVVGALCLAAGAAGAGDYEEIKVGNDMVVIYATPGQYVFKPTVAQARILVVGGGGAGGTTIGGGGGGGAVVDQEVTFSPGQDYVVTVGAGGQLRCGTTLVGVDPGYWQAGGSGEASSIVGDGVSLVAGGGGGGGGWRDNNLVEQQGQPGVNGGGGSHGAAGADSTGGGYDGGDANSERPGGGAGAGGNGENGQGSRAGNGGPGIDSDITGEFVNYGAGGGGGGGNSSYTPGEAGGDSAGAGAAKDKSVVGDSGKDGRGGGGGGGGYNSPTAGGVGGCGCVIIRYTMLDESSLLVASSSAAYGTPNPGYGLVSFGDTDTHALVQPTDRIELSDGVCAFLTGWTLESVDLATGENTVVRQYPGTAEAGESKTQCNYRHEGAAVLTWNWEVRALFSVSSVSVGESKFGQTDLEVAFAGIGFEDASIATVTVRYGMSPTALTRTAVGTIDHIGAVSVPLTELQVGHACYARVSVRNTAGETYEGEVLSFVQPEVFEVGGDPRIRKMPAGYVQMEKLTSTGEESILTDWIPNNTSAVEMELGEFVWKNSECVIFGQGYAGNCYLMTVQGNQFKFYGPGSSVNPDSTVQPNTDYLIKTEPTGGGNGRVTVLNRATGASVSPELSLAGNGGKFAIFSANDRRFKAAFSVYSFKAWKDRLLALDLVPAYKVSSDEAGLYDLVNGAFYASDGGSKAFARQATLAESVLEQRGGILVATVAKADADQTVSLFAGATYGGTNEWGDAARTVTVPAGGTEATFDLPSGWGETVWYARAKVSDSESAFWTKSLVAADAALPSATLVDARAIGLDKIVLTGAIDSFRGASCTVTPVVTDHNTGAAVDFSNDAVTLTEPGDFAFELTGANLPAVGETYAVCVEAVAGDKLSRSRLLTVPVGTPAELTPLADGENAQIVVTVEGDPDSLVAVTPNCGRYAAEADKLYSFSAPTSATVGERAYALAGYEVYDAGADTPVISGTGNSFAFASVRGGFRVVWVWDVLYDTKVAVSGVGGTAAAEQDSVARGGTARFTATSEPGYAVAWSGDLLETTMFGNELVLENVQEPVEVVATFYKPSSSAGELKGPYATFAHRTSVVFDGYAGEETLLDFPALVRVSEGAGGFSYAQCVAGNGKDVRFSLADGIELPSEVAVWNPSGESAFWVRLPVLRGRDTRIVMHWGAANPPAREQAGSVWSEDYNGVWAFEDEKRMLRDSTRHGQHGSASFDSDRSEGVVGRARTFAYSGGSEGSANYALAGHANGELQYKASVTTWECWYRWAGSTDGKQHVLLRAYTDNGYCDCRISVADNGLARVNGEGGQVVGALPPAVPDEWHHVMFVVDGTKATAYTDGVKTWYHNNFGKAWDGWSINGAPDMGVGFSYLRAFESFRPYSGQLDEARVSRVCRSQDYALAVYSNVAHNDSFLSFESASNMPHLTVTGDEIPLAEGATSPAYGVYPADMSIDVSAMATCEQGGVRWVCEGYTLSADGKEIASGDGGAVKVNWPADSTDVVVRWHWRRQYAVTVAGDESCTVEPAGTDWYDAGTALAVTATVAGTERAFYAWGGNCPTLEVFNASITLPVDRPRSVTALSGKAFHVEAGTDTLIDVLTNDVASTGEYPAVVLAGPGTYTFTHKAGTYALTLDKQVALRSTDGSAATVLDFEARANAYGIKTTTKGAYVGGFTLANLYVTTDDWNGANKNGLFLNPGHACDCVVDGMKEVGNKSATISTAGGWIRNCKVINTQQGTGTRYDGFCVWVKDTLVESCVFSNNLTRGGGVVYMSNDASGNSTTFRNCLFVGNTAHVGADNGLNGGAIGIATGTIQGKVPLIENCLFVDNTIVETSGRGGAIYYKDSANNVMLQVVNSLFDGNSVPGGEAYGLDAYGSVLFFNCAGSGITPENGSLAAAPVFRDREGHDFHVSGLSPTRDAGGLVEQALTPGATDFDGTARVKDGRIDIGPYEYEADVEPFGVNFVADVVKGTGALTVSFSALLAGDTEGVTYEWDFGDGKTSAEAAPVHVYGSGYFNVSLTVRNGAGETATFAKEKFVTVIPKVCYVRPDSENPVDPYMTPETAARTLADALVVATDTINVDGTVDIPASLNVLLPLTICGESQETSVLKIGASVVLTLTGRGANLRNLTVQTGSLSWSGAPVVIKAGASATNCVFTGTEYRAVELQGGSVVDSVFRNYTANRHNYSAGINVTAGGSVIDRCVFTNNVSGRQGYDDVTRSMGVRIDQKYTPATVIRNSLFANNRGVWTGVPSNGSNSTNVCAGAVYTAGNTLIENCTIANNSTYQSTARRTAGITVVGTGVEIVNTIAWGTAVTNKDEQVESVIDLYVLDGVECDVRNSCAADLAPGNGNVAADPKFRNAQKRDYRIKSSSPCFNTGALLREGMENEVDLEGNPRLIWKRPDMGCYECVKGGGFLLLVK